MKKSIKIKRVLLHLLKRNKKNLYYSEKLLKLQGNTKSKS